MKKTSCDCLALRSFVARSGYDNNLRCGNCTDAILEDKNEAVREIFRLRNALEAVKNALVLEPALPSVPPPSVSPYDLRDYITGVLKEPNDGNTTDESAPALGSAP